jgi:hypothetical protein
LENQNILRILYHIIKSNKSMRNLILKTEVPIYLIIIGLLTLKTNLAMAIILFVLSLFRLYLNVNLNLK